MEKKAVKSVEEKAKMFKMRDFKGVEGRLDLEETEGSLHPDWQRSPTRVPNSPDTLALPLQVPFIWFHPSSMFRPPLLSGPGFGF